MPKIRAAVLISGRGSNMEALIKASKTKDYPATIELVISNRPEAAGLEIARKYGVKAVSVDHTQFAERNQFEDNMQQELTAADTDLICCAGFMRILTQSFTQNWSGRLINIHPSLLPKYKGLNTHQRALDAGDALHGCTVHFVTPELDSGDIIAQDSLPITANDTAEGLAAKVNEKELTLYPKALKKVALSILTNSELICP